MDSDFNNYGHSRKKYPEIVPNFVKIFGKPFCSYIPYGGIFYVLNLRDIQFESRQWHSLFYILFQSFRY
jgi:hypothetical protein